MVIRFMKNKKRNSISDDERWVKYEQLKKEGKVLEAKKLKSIILDSYIWKKPCHHVNGDVN